MQFFGIKPKKNEATMPAFQQQLCTALMAGVSLRQRGGKNQAD
jgi:hypothetical protein